MARSLTDAEIRRMVLNIEPLYREARHYGVAQAEKANPGNDTAADTLMYEHLDSFIASRRTRLVAAINSLSSPDAYKEFAKAVTRINDQLDIDVPISLTQQGIDKFTVKYGLHVIPDLSYATAAQELGECIMHALACKQLITSSDN